MTRLTFMTPNALSTLLPTLLQAAAERPFPVPSEALQYRAIGLIEGRYLPEADHITKGNIETTDGATLDAVLLGRVLSLVRKHLDLSQNHLWVAYPRTRESGGLHAQIVGVWSPAGALAAPQAPPVAPNYFSVRGEVVFQDSQEGYVLVKIRQQKKKKKPSKAFKLRLEGFMPDQARGKFWDFEVYRQDIRLEITDVSFVAAVPKAVGRKSLRRPGATYDRVFKPSGNDSLPRPVRPPRP